MSRLDNDIKAVIDDMAEQAQTLLPKLLAVMVDDELDEDDIMQKIASIMEESKPKTYDIYIHDIKQAFRNDGWREPETTKATDFPVMHKL